MKIRLLQLFLYYPSHKFCIYLLFSIFVYLHIFYSFIICKYFLWRNIPTYLPTYLPTFLPTYSVSYFFFLYRLPSSALCMVFDSVSSNVDEVLSINLSANVFVFGDFNIHHKDWLTYSGGTDQPGEPCYNFCISNDLTQMVNFPTRIPD